MITQLEVRGLTVGFPAGSALIARLRGRPAPIVTALDGINLKVERASSVGIVGESGCGKSTLAKALVGLVPTTAGTILLDGNELGARRDRPTRRRIQMVFQDPSSSLNPSRTVQQTLSELLRVHRIVPDDEIPRRCAEILELVELPSTLLGAYPHRLSGGQRQRVGIARALTLEPDVLIADEAVAALDVSVQASVLNLLSDLQAQLSLTLIVISHDLAVVRHISQRIIVMYLGRIVEDRPAEELFDDPRHPYTSALMAAAPKLGEKKRAGEMALAGEPPGLLEIPTACRFHPRCPIAQEICRVDDPPLEGPQPHSLAACHFAWSTPRTATHRGAHQKGRGDDRIRTG
jgi:oligopeptide/dipeptide ABC transporter ATP-binding protein